MATKTPECNPHTSTRIERNQPIGLGKLLMDRTVCARCQKTVTRISAQGRLAPGPWKVAK